VWVTAFIIVVFAGVEAGLASAVGLSLLIVLWKVPASCQPAIFVLHLLLLRVLAGSVALQRRQDSGFEKHRPSVRLKAHGVYLPI
jgi:hypothetical protein